MATNFTIRATVGPEMLTLADRLFRNDNEGIFVELLQNSRRAGATRIEVSIQPVPESDQCEVTFHDNGSGIQDFSKLLALWKSGWSAETKAAEDPAGVGFYCLCHSDVEIRSGQREMVIRKAAFLGFEEPLGIVHDGEGVEGTWLRFRRSAEQHVLRGALAGAAFFCPLEVQANGAVLPSADFLEGSIYRETIDGIEVGFATEFENDWSSVDDRNWNFYGARIAHSFPSLSAFPPSGKAYGAYSAVDLHLRFNVLQTGKVWLQLPDRRALIENDFLREFKDKVRLAACRAVQSVGQHVLAFSDWKKAAALGIELPEAVPWLETWNDLSPDRNSGAGLFGSDVREIVSDLSNIALVSDDLPNRHTLQGALHCRAMLPYRLYRECSRFEGYSWYNALPKVTDAQVIIDGVPAPKYHEKKRKKRPKEIEIQVVVECGDSKGVSTLPAVLHVDTEAAEDSGSLEFIVVRDSLWDSTPTAAPFSIESFLMYATFTYSDDDDTWDTQEQRHREKVQEAINEYFQGSRGLLLAQLEGCAGAYLANLCKKLKVQEIKLIPPRAKGKAWSIELTDKNGNRL